MEYAEDSDENDYFDDELTPPSHTSPSGNNGSLLNDGIASGGKLAACAYCGIEEPSVLAQCGICSRWFCNCDAGGGQSHIVHHLVRAKHKEVRTLNDTQLIDLECYNCGTKNIFKLGLIINSSTNEARILCRDVCFPKDLGDSSWDKGNYENMIVSKHITDCLVSCPPISDFHDNSVKLKDCERLEKIWLTKKEATVSALYQQDETGEILFEDVELPDIPLTFDDRAHYADIFRQFVTYERDVQKAATENTVITEVSIRFISGGIDEMASGKKSERSVVIEINEDLFDDFRVNVGDNFLVSNPSFEPEKGIGIKFTITSIGMGNIRMSGSRYGFPSSLTTGYTIKAIFNDISYARMLKALKKLEIVESCVHSSIMSRLLGQVDRNEFPSSYRANLISNIPNQPELNTHQLHAIQFAMNRTVSLIQGPPGTGKTVVSVALVYNLVKNGAKTVLVCAPTNVAADQLAVRLNQTGIKVLRVLGSSREEMYVGSEVEPLCLHYIVPRVDAAIYELYLEQLNNGTSKKEIYQSKLPELKAIEMQVINSAEVICCTLSVASNYGLDGVDAVLIDEATQAREPETLIPMVHECKQLILVGDHQQLGPTIVNNNCKHHHYGRSLFERLIILGEQSVMLKVQYRMHPCLSEFPSNTFYNGELQNGVTASQRSHRFNIKWPNANVPMMFWSVEGEERLGNAGMSCVNETEASCVKQIVQQLLSSGIQGSSIGVISPYVGQIRQIQMMFAREARSGGLMAGRFLEVDVNSVDSYQGSEKEYIVYSCVRCNKNGNIGFLTDKARLNVAITRAKYGLFIIGNPETLREDSVWNSLMIHCRSKMCLVEGPLVALQASLAVLNSPGKFFSSRRARTSQMMYKDAHSPYYDPSPSIFEQNADAQLIRQRDVFIPFVNNLAGESEVAPMNDTGY